MSVNSFVGVLFHPNIPEGKSEATILLQRGCFELKPHQAGQHQTYELRFEDLKMYRGGAGDLFIFFASKTHSNVSFYLHEKTDILNRCEELLPEGSLKSEALNLKKTGMRSRLLAGSVGLAFLLLVVLGVSQWSTAMAGLARLVPFSWEKKLGDKIIGYYLKPGTYIADDPTNAAMKKMMSALKPGVGDFYRQFNFHIVKDPQLNAFALPGGHIIFTTGMLLAAESAEEVLGVAAHEMAHVTQRHVMKSVIGSLGIGTVAQLILGDISGIIAIMVSQSEFLLRQTFSRANESAADTIGFEYLRDSMVNPRGMIRFFQRLLDQNKTQEKLEKYVGFLSTHPATQERIRHLSDLIDAEKGKKFPSSTFAFAAFQQQIKRKESKHGS